MHCIYEESIVQAKVIAVAEKILCVEIFGVECSIMAWDGTGLEMPMSVFPLETRFL